MEKQYRIYLRPIEEKHTKLIVQWRNNKRVFDNFIFSEKITEEMHQNWLNNQVKKGKVVQFIIYIKKIDIPIGSVYFRDIDKKTGVAEYGIFIGEDNYIGKGYGTEAAELALQYAFSKMKLKRVFLRVFAGNKSAIKSYEKVGFKQIEYKKNAVIKNGEKKDLIFMNFEKTKGENP